MGNIFSDLLNSPCVTRTINCLADCFWNLALKHATHVYQLEDNLVALQTAIEDVRVLKNQLMERVRVAELEQTRLLRRSEQAELWFRRAVRAIIKGDELMRESEQQVQRLCLGGVCSANYLSSSVFGGEVVKSRKNLTDLNAAGKQLEEEGLTRDAIADQPYLGAEKPCDPTVGLESKVKEVLSCLEKQEVGIVGLYGLGGVGKTTLLKQINNHFVCPSSDFCVVWIDMPEDLERREMIQQDILGKFGLLNDWKHESIEQRAEYISKALQQKKFLLLLDDIKKPFDLSTIGVPHPSALNGSKVVFTTRAEDACNQMNPKPQRIIAVETLTEENAWELFQMQVGEDTLNSGPGILQLAERVARKCRGLPLALKIIGEAMSKKKEAREWEHAIQTFERPSNEDEHGIDKVCSLLRYSYDNLPSETVKSCFLYFALYPKGRIGRKILIETWTFEDFWIDSDEPEFKGYCILSALFGACLLERDGGYIRLHDVVRSMALRIVKEDTLVRVGMNLREAPSSGGGEWKRMKRVSLMINNIKELTEVPVCPNLLTLLLSHNRELHNICGGFFESMGKLGVLKLSHTDVQELPKSISRLVSLRYLDISSTRITKLPIALRVLKRLRFLNVDGLSLVFERSRQVIRYLSSLQVLKINCKYCYDHEGVAGSGDGKENDEMLLEELQCLHHLNVLEIRIESSSGLDKLLNTGKLLKITKTLCLFGFKTPARMDLSVVATTEHLEQLEIRRCDFEELKFDSPGHQSRSSANGPFYSIDVVIVVDCHHLQDLTWLVLFPNLRGLAVRNCTGLREIIRGGENQRPLYNLVRLTLFDLPALQSIYPRRNGALPLPFLLHARITGCPQLNRLPLDSNSTVPLSRYSLIELTAAQDWWNALEWENDSTKAALLPRFKLLPP